MHSDSDQRDCCRLSTGQPGLLRILLRSIVMLEMPPETRKTVKIMKSGVRIYSARSADLHPRGVMLLVSVLRPMR